MTKTEFLSALGAYLAALPPQDREKSIEYYSEMIDDRVEEGISEEEVIASLGHPADIAAQILAESPPPEEKPMPEEAHSRIRGWEIVLLVLGAPLWIPLLIAALAVVLSLFAVLWSVILAIWAAVLGCGAAALAGLTAGALSFFAAEPLAGIFLLGAGCICAGVTLAAWLFSWVAARAAWAVTAWSVRSLLHIGRRKENNA